MKRLQEVQSKLKAPKSNFNKFGNYNYRSAEDILSAVKPLLAEVGLVMVVHDDLVQVGERYYVKAIVNIFDEESFNEPPIATTTAYARESDVKKGMDSSQITGTASSYARKYALNGMFLIDDVKDAETDEYHEQTKVKRVSKSVITAKIKQAGVKDIDKLYGSYGVKSYDELTDEQTDDLATKLTLQAKKKKDAEQDN